MKTDNNDPGYGGLELRLMELERRVDFMEKVVARIEGTLQQMDKRLTRLEDDLREFRKEVKEDLKALRSEVRGEFKAVYGRVDRVLWTVLATFALTVLLRILGVI